MLNSGDNVRIIVTLAFGLLAMLGGEAGAAPAISQFLGDPALSHVRMSPSGRYLAFVTSDGATDELDVKDLQTNQVRRLLVTRPIDKSLVAWEARQRIAYVQWKGDDRVLAAVSIPDVTYLSDKVLRHAYSYFVAPRDGGGIVPLNSEGWNNQTIGRSSIVSVLKNDPSHILMMERGGLYKVDLRDKSRTFVETVGESVIDLGADIDGNVVTHTRRGGSPSAPYLAVDVRAPGETSWTKVWEVHRKDLKALDDITILDDPSRSGEVYALVRPKAGVQPDTQTVQTFNLKTKAFGPALWSNPKYDADSIVVNADSGAFMGACYYADIQTCEFKDSALDGEYKGLAKFFDGRAGIDVVSMSDDAQNWVLLVTGPEEPASYYLYDRHTHHLEPLGSAWPRLQSLVAGAVRHFDFTARDGTALSGYVTRPKAAGPLPLIVMPHGGPQARDVLTYDIWAQFFASRGYEVIQPNFRGSSGFGRGFTEAGFRQWGGLMQDDVTDAVRALIKTGEVDPARICIVGASYGGYAALYGVAADPDLYRCAISVSGISDLHEILAQSRSDYGADSPFYEYDRKAIGDPAKDGPMLDAKSPNKLAARIKAPVLLIHGTEDDRVPIDQSRYMKRALEREGKPVEYLEVKDMGHGPELDRDRTTVLAAMERFLAQHLAPSP